MIKTYADAADVVTEFYHKISEMDRVFADKEDIQTLHRMLQIGFFLKS